MSRFARTSVRLALAAASATGLVVAGMPGAQAAPHRPAARSGAVLHVAITDHHLYVDGPTTIAAGRVHISLEDARAKGDASVSVIRLNIGYTWSDLRSDLKVAFTNLFGPNGNKKKGLKHLNHAIDNTTFYGGIGAKVGHTKHFELLLGDTSSRYFIFDDSHSLPRHPQHLTVTGPVGAQTLPATDGTVTAKTNRRFGGDRVLPAKGVITFRNLSTESPHFLVMQHVKAGTTRKDVISGLQSNGPPDFVRPGEADVEVLSLNREMAFHVNLPAGKYALMCFFPDPKTGDPHAFMGMVRMVHLK